jgi:hypothetical protein
VNLHSQASKNLSLQFASTLSRAIDPGGSSDLSGVSNPYNRAYDIGPSALDRTHIALVNFIYQLPIFNGSQSRLVKSTLGGWEVSGIVDGGIRLAAFRQSGWVSGQQWSG